MLQTPGVGLGDSGGEEREAGSLRCELAEAGKKRRVGLVGEDEAGLGAELPGAEREGGVQASGDRLAALGECARQDEDGIGAPHLGVNGDGLWTGGG